MNWSGCLGVFTGLCEMNHAELLSNACGDSHTEKEGDVSHWIIRLLLMSK